MFEKNNPQGRQGEIQRRVVAVRRDGEGFRAPEIALAAAAVIGGVTVQDLLPEAACRHPHPIVVMHHRSEIADYQDSISEARGPGEDRR